MNTINSDNQFGQRLVGVLLGTAIGDALGLPMENLSPEKIRRRWPGPLKMGLIFGRGMISDDTEHTLMVAQALLAHPENSIAFQRALGWKFRWWFAALPAGVGMATAKACIRLWMGFPTNKCSVISGGGGPAMRSAIIGAFFCKQPERRREFVLASSRLTHRGWQAETAALAVAEAAALAVNNNRRPDISEVIAVMRVLSPEHEWHARLSEIESSLRKEDSVSEFACSLGLKNGVTGFALHVVPVALYAWLRHPKDFRAALSAAIACGGDTDTVGAILGGLVGATSGPEGIPGEWLSNLWEWPRSRGFMIELGKRLEDRGTERSEGGIRYFWPGVVPRNLFFLSVVLAHGFRRLAPPY